MWLKELGTPWSWLARWYFYQRQQCASATYFPLFLVELTKFNSVKNTKALKYTLQKQVTQHKFDRLYQSVYGFILIMLGIIWNLKEELHNMFNLILEDRGKNFKHNSDNLMKISWKIRKLWHFEVSRIFKKQFLTSRYEYVIILSEVMMSSPHNFPLILYTEMTKISYFIYENVRHALIPIWIDAE